MAEHRARWEVEAFVDFFVCHRRLVLALWLFAPTDSASAYGAGMDKWGRSDTLQEVEALIAKVPHAADAYDAATEVLGAAIGALDKADFDARIYLLWACFTDWVELEPEEEAEAQEAMRAAAREWPRIKDEAKAVRASYFDRWMFDVISVNRALPRDWEMRIEEVSTGVYRVTAEARDGRTISATGDNPLALTSQVGQQVDELTGT